MQKDIFATDCILNTVIIGSGPAGCTAAVYTCRAGLEPVLIEGPEVGGQLVTTPEIANWPGEYEEPSGFDLMMKMREHAKKQGTVFVSDTVVKTELCDRVKLVHLASGKILRTLSVIIATGAKARYLGLESESLYKGRGVSACATCDGFFFRGRPVAVVGGGSAAFAEALYLTKMCSHVTIIHRRDGFRAEKVLVRQFDDLVAAGKASYALNAKVVEVLGIGEAVTGLKLDVGGDEQELSCAAVFVAVGHDPATSVFAEVQRNERGYIMIGQGAETATSQMGVFAAGDCCDEVYRQAITSAGQGCKAALDCERYLSSINT